MRSVAGVWLAVADLAGTPEVVAADRLDLAIYLSFWPLGGEVARRMTDSVTTIDPPRVVVDES